MGTEVVSAIDCTATDSTAGAFQQQERDDTSSSSSAAPWTTPTRSSPSSSSCNSYDANVPPATPSLVHNDNSNKSSSVRMLKRVPSSISSPTVDTSTSSSGTTSVSSSSVLSDTPRSVGQESFLSSFSSFPPSSSAAAAPGTTVRVPLPSPSKPRIHPGYNYASRLATPRLRSAPPPPSRAEPTLFFNSNGNSNTSTPTSTAESIDDHKSVRMPPEISREVLLRCPSHFRPTPIVTCDPHVFGGGDVGTIGEGGLDANEDNFNCNDVSLLEDDSVDFHTARTSFSTTTGAPTPLSSTSTSSSLGGGSEGAHIFSMASSSARSRRPLRRDDPSLDVGVSDRYIPSRATSSFHFNMWDGMPSSSAPSTPRTPASLGGGGSSLVVPASSSANVATASDSSSTPRTNPVDATAADLDEPEENGYNPTTTGSASQQGLLNTLLRSELLGENDAPTRSSGHPGRFGPSSASLSTLSAAGNAPLRDGANCLRYVSPRQMYQDGVSMLHGGDGSPSGRSSMNHPTSIVNSFSLSALGSATSQRLMAAPPKRKRRISKVPFKVLDAPSLQDDFYLNLVDWSSQNVLAVGLGSCVYLWSACTSKVTKLCDLAASEDVVTAVSWAQRGTHLAVGTNRGEVQLWDTVHCAMVRSMPGHSARVGTLAWSGPMLASGSRDRLIYLRDVRAESAFTDTLSNHKQEVCGLKFSFDEPSFLASGGNDNHLHVIDPRNTQAPLFEFADHTAAVKAIAWSPHQHGLLASGGGTADRCIRFWNTLSGVSLNKIDTGSQVCNLAWSQNCNELVSTHGYSLNQIVIWRYPSMTKVTTLTGHAYRVLYLSMSPDGSTIVTGAGDETLRFWQVFPGPRADGKESSSSLLFPRTLGSEVR